MVYCDDICVLGVLDLAQYTHMKYVAGKDKMNETVVCTVVCVCVCVCELCVYVCSRACMCVSLCVFGRETYTATCRSTPTNQNIHVNTSKPNHPPTTPKHAISPSTHITTQHNPASAPRSATHRRPCSQSLAWASHHTIARTNKSGSPCSPDWQK